MSIPSDEKINWFRIITDLCSSHGYTHQDIATVIRGVSRSTVQGWKQGATPRYEEGQRLIDLWIQVTGKSQETVHKVKRYSHLA